MPSAIVLKCCKALAENNLRIAFAESILAGSLGGDFLLAPESRQVLSGGMVC